MDLDGLLFRYFGAREPGDVDPALLAAGVERMQVDFGLARDPGQRFALWWGGFRESRGKRRRCLMYMLGSAPDLDVAFRSEAERDAARNFMDLLAAQP